MNWRPPGGQAPERLRNFPGVLYCASYTSQYSASRSSVAFHDTGAGRRRARRAHCHFRRDRKARSYAASRMKDHCRDPGRTQDGTRPDRGARAGSRAHVTLTVSDSLLTRGFAPPRPRTGSGPEGARRRPRTPEVRIEAAAAKRFERVESRTGHRGCGTPGTARSRGHHATSKIRPRAYTTASRRVVRRK